MKKKIQWYDFFLILTIVVLISLFYFAQNRNAAREVSDIKVKFVGDENHFLTQNMVNNLLIQNLKSTSNIRKEALDLNALERKLSSNKMIASSEVYVNEKGELFAEVVQKEAIARVLGNGISFYLDTEGDTISLSKNFSAHVPVVRGVLRNENKKVFAEFLNKIKNDDFLRMSIVEIAIQPDQSVVLKDRGYDFDIEFGKLKEIDKKINNYKVFLSYSQRDTLMSNYTKVNLKFTEQVVCTK